MTTTAAAKKDSRGFALPDESQQTEWLMDPDWEEYTPEKGSFVHHMVAGSFAGIAEHVRTQLFVKRL